MNYFLKDIIEIYPLEEFLEFPAKEDYLVPDFVTLLNSSGLYSETKIINRIKRKYLYNEIGTSDVSQFYDYINQLIEENYIQYLMNLVSISEFYSIQNMDTKIETFSHKIDAEGKVLTIDNNTPSSKLNIENIKEGRSASNVTYQTDSGLEYTDTTTIEATSPLNTTQSNVDAQIKLNEVVQTALNSFVDSLAPAFSIIVNEYYNKGC